MSEPRFKIGSPVKIRATGEISAVAEIKMGLDDQYRYYVYLGGRKKRFKESDLEQHIDVSEALSESLDNGDFQSADQLQMYLYYHLFSDNREENIYSYQGNRLIFNPYQYKPLLKFLSPESEERLLVADEVGVGKTIESGIIIDELMARKTLQVSDPVMIVCPNALCQKWRKELIKRFRMDDYQIMDGKALTYLLQNIIDSGSVAVKHSIVSEQLIRGEQYRLLLEECLKATDEPFIEMLVVDECHHYRNPKTNTFKLGRTLSLCSRRVLMLSATPFNLKSDDLFYQLNMLNPGLFPDLSMYNALLHQIRRVNRCTALLKTETKEAKEELLRNINALIMSAGENELLIEKLGDLREEVANGKVLTPGEVVRYEGLFNTFNPIAPSFTRTLKRDALEHRVTREVKTLKVEFTSQESAIYNSFLEANLLRYEMTGVSEQAFGLIMNGLERIASSSIPALARNVRYFMEYSDHELIDYLENDYGIDRSEALQMGKVLKEQYKELLVQINNLNGIDSKYDVLQQLISSIREDENGKEGIMIFSFYTGTLRYLRKRLTADGYKVGLMYGATPTDPVTSLKYDEDGFVLLSRDQITSGFERGEYDILLVSEVGGEGLDFQFCSALINYDLPYNPMRIEQRIGRIDRMGQQADKIIIGNLCVQGTIDQVIDAVLMSRISDAEDLVGEMEPIITAELEDINKLLITKKLTNEELEKREKELGERIERSKQARLEFDNARYELVNDREFRSEFEDTIRKSRISPVESKIFTSVFLKMINGCWSKDKSETSLRVHLTKDMKDKMKSYALKSGEKGKLSEITRIYSSQEDPVLTFSGDENYNSPDTILVKPSGPWIHFILDYIDTFDVCEKSRPYKAAVKKDNCGFLEKGEYYLFIYEIELEGYIKSRIQTYILVTVDNPKLVMLEEQQLKGIFTGLYNDRRNSETEYDTFDEARDIADMKADDIKDDYVSRNITGNIMKIDSRIEALKHIARGRISKLEADLIGTDTKTASRIKKAIEREEIKTEEKIAILEEKKRYSSNTSLQGVCIISVY